MLHSPIFIDEQTITNTFRCFIKGEESKIIRPNGIDHKQKELLQFLTYTNSSRIFFSDVVILVEGYSDEYFFKYFYNNHYLKKSKKRANVEFLSIGGKGNYKKWKTFLDLFEISNAFIGDFDNIKNYCPKIKYDQIIEKTKADLIIKVASKIINSGQSKDAMSLFSKLDEFVQIGDVEKFKQDIRDLWSYLLERCGVSIKHLKEFLCLPENQPLHKEIQEEILKKYGDGIYILQQGDLEAYLNVSKDVSNVIDFCLNKFEKWLEEETSNSSKSKLSELENIIDQIVKY